MTEMVAETSPARRGTGWRVVRIVVAVLVLAGALALSVAAGNPAIGGAAAVGVGAIALLLLVVRRARRPRTGPRRRRVVVWLLGGLAAVVLALCALAGTVYFYNSAPNTGGATADPLLTVQYFGEGRLAGDTLVLDESIVLNGPSMPDVAAPDVAGWIGVGLVDGNPSFTRTRTLSWDRNSYLADSMEVPLQVGTLTGTAKGQSFRARLVARAESRLQIALPKGAVGSAVPAVTSRTDALAGRDEETITFSVDQYVSAVSFDVLRGPLRNPAGHAIYEASLWGFWQWAAGAAGAVVSGVLVDKVGGALWGGVVRLFRRRGSAAAGTLGA